VLETLNGLGLNKNFGHLKVKRDIERRSLDKLRNKLRIKETLPKLTLKDLELQYADRRTPEHLRQAISSSDLLVKNCKKELITSFDRQHDIEYSDLLDKNNDTNLQAINELIEMLDNQLNPEQKISLENIRRQIIYEKDGNQAFIQQEMQELFN